MKKLFTRLAARVLPFIIIGIALIFFILGIIVLSYILLLGALVGVVLFIIAFVYGKFKQHKKITAFDSHQPHQPGRVIDQNNDTENK